MTVVTVAHYRLPDAEELREKVLAALAPIVRATRAESGNRGIEVVRDEADPCHLILIERWADANALAAHRATAHFTEGIVGTIAPQLRGRDVTIAHSTGL